MNQTSVAVDGQQHLDNADLIAGTAIDYSVTGTVCEPAAAATYTINISSTNTNLRDGFFKRITNNGGAASVLTIHSTTVPADFTDTDIYPGEFADMYYNVLDDGTTYRWSIQGGGGAMGAIWDHVEADPSDGDFVRLNSANVDYDGDEGFVVPAQTMSNAAGGTRFFFDGSTGAVRGGTTTAAQWDVASRGSDSVAFGRDTTVSGNRSFGCGSTQTVSGNDSAALAGTSNTVSNDDSAVVAGLSNTVSASQSGVLAGNTIQVSNSESGVVAGNTNTVSGTRSGIIAGSSNIVRGTNCAVGAGSTNVIALGVTASGVLAGTGNNIDTGAGSAAIAGGTSNFVSENNSFVGAGTANLVQNFCDRSAIVAGGANAIYEAEGTSNNSDNAIVAGNGCTIGDSATLNPTAIHRNIIGAGLQNAIGDNSATTMNCNGIFAGRDNTITDAALPCQYNMIGAGQSCEISGNWCFIGAGQDCHIVNGRDWSVICGGLTNSTDSNYTFTGAGTRLDISQNCPYSAIVAGGVSTIGSGGVACEFCFIGAGNSIDIGDSGAANKSAIVAGDTNTINDADNCFIGAGNGNDIRTGGNNHCIVAGTANDISTSAGENNGILAGNINIIGDSGTSAIIAGTTNTINNTNTHSLIGVGNGNSILTSTGANAGNAILTGINLELGGNTVSNTIYSAIVCGANSDLGKNGNEHVEYSAILCGDSNELRADGGNEVRGSAICAGFGQKVFGTLYSGIVAGTYNTINDSDYSAIVCGGNDVPGNLNQIVGTSTNCIIGGGHTNTIQTTSTNSAIVAGLTNTLSTGVGCAIVAGTTNTIDDSSYTAVLAGNSNRIGNQTGGLANNAAIICGNGNDIAFTNNVDCTGSIIISGSNCRIGGGVDNVILQGQSSVIFDAGGAAGNVLLSGVLNTVVGGSDSCIWDHKGITFPPGTDNYFIAAGDSVSIGWSGGNNTWLEYWQPDPGVGGGAAVLTTVPAGWNVNHDGWVAMRYNGNSIGIPYWLAP